MSNVAARTTGQIFSGRVLRLCSGLAMIAGYPMYVIVPLRWTYRGIARCEGRKVR